MVGAAEHLGAAAQEAGQFTQQRTGALVFFIHPVLEGGQGVEHEMRVDLRLQQAQISLGGAARGRRRVRRAARRCDQAPSPAPRGRPARPTRPAAAGHERGAKPSAGTSTSPSEDCRRSEKLDPVDASRGLQVLADRESRTRPPAGTPSSYRHQHACAACLRLSMPCKGLSQALMKTTATLIAAKRDSGPSAQCPGHAGALQRPSAASDRTKPAGPDGRAAGGCRAGGRPPRPARAAAGSWLADALVMRLRPAVVGALQAVALRQRVLGGEGWGVSWRPL